MSRKLVAVLAVRNEGTRLYGKPLQNLDIENGVTILDHMVSVLQTLPFVEDIVIGISDGPANMCYKDFAARRGVKHIVGSPSDVLGRIIDSAHAGEGTDILRITTESPFFHYQMIEEVWQVHQAHNNDVSVIDSVPEGTFFEIFSLECLERSHSQGEDRHRSEYISLYIRENKDQFTIERVPIPAELDRIHDLRLTVDYPEDLIVCREVYMGLRDKAPYLTLPDIIAFLDTRPDLVKLVEAFVYPTPLYP